MSVKSVKPDTNNNQTNSSNNQDTTNEKYPYLAKYGTNLTAEYRENNNMQPIVGRDHEIRRAIEILSQKYKNNLMLVGLPGVGKTALVEGIAQRIVQHKATSNLNDKDIWIIDLASLTSTDTRDGGFYVRFRNLLNEIEDADGKIIPFIDEVHTIMGAGSKSGSLDAANILKPALARGRLHMIGATTLREYHVNMETDGAITRRFGKIMIDEPTPEQAVEILKGRRRPLEIYHGVTITDDAIQASVDLSVRYLTNRYLPDKAIDLLDQACSNARLDIDAMPADIESLQTQIAELKNNLETEKNKAKQKALQAEIDQLEPKAQTAVDQWKVQKKYLANLKRGRQKLEKANGDLRLMKTITQPTKEQVKQIASLKQEIAELETQLPKFKKLYRDQNPIISDEVTNINILHVIEEMTGIPVSQLTKTERERLLTLENRLHERIIGQNKAVSETAYAIKRSRLGLSDPSKPIGTFLFLGPTGVGKTELVKALAEQMFGDENAMIRFDMGEFQDRRSIARLVGASPGDDGYEDGGELTEWTKNHPYSIILFDEAEKANPGIWDLMLSIFDDGEITDNHGEKVDFKNNIIIMTSNIGSADILNGINSKGELATAAYNDVMAMLKNTNPSANGRGFRPEFINRLDAIEFFLPITREQDELIARLKLKKTKELLYKSRKIRLVYSAPIEKFARESEGPILTVSYMIAAMLSADELKLGGRPINKYIREQIEDPLTDLLLNKGVPDGSNIYIEVAYPKRASKWITDEEGHQRPVDPEIKLSQVSDAAYKDLIKTDPIEHLDLHHVLPKIDTLTSVIINRN